MGVRQVLPKCVSGSKRTSPMARTSDEVFRATSWLCTEPNYTRRELCRVQSVAEIFAKWFNRHECDVKIVGIVLSLCNFILSSDSNESTVQS